MLPPIIIYIHICQKGLWTIPFDMIMSEIRNSGLYDACIEIRLGVGNEVGYVIPDERFNDPKIKIVAQGHSNLYERITLVHMWNYAHTDNAQYLYCHTKGISYLSGNDEHRKNCVMDWVKLMIYWNITQWRNASNKLMTNDIYGCEFCSTHHPHYSGNFHWSNSHYIRTLPEHIGNEYCDPEFWIFKRNNILWYNAFSSGLAGGQAYFHRCIKGINY